ncbi:hypothetical protein BCR34DRAFT_252805 [Clohesyomyces aquaticus]|uniref:Uncharacterized protein n=1 Tax=Clohesyomyces aquaticus TaxID=1231657 RepID=A0A1Y1ZUV9_9PLEO|nr:hypothetical protein BCR34DRAFT_252805 [Clohesyomyces aquaticus]
MYGNYVPEYSPYDQVIPSPADSHANLLQNRRRRNSFSSFYSDEDDDDVRTLAALETWMGNEWTPYASRSGLRATYTLSIADSVSTLGPELPPLFPNGLDEMPGEQTPCRRPTESLFPEPLRTSKMKRESNTHTPPASQKPKQTPELPSKPTPAAKQPKPAYEYIPAKNSRPPTLRLRPAPQSSTNTSALPIPSRTSMYSTWSFSNLDQALDQNQENDSPPPPPSRSTPPNEHGIPVPPIPASASLPGGSRTGGRDNVMSSQTKGTRWGDTYDE